MKKKLKIFIDHQIFTMQNYGGISRVFTELYKEFEKRDDVELIFPILLSDNEYISEIKKVWSIFPKNKSFFKKSIYYIINRIYSTVILIKGGFDIFQPTYYDPYFLPFLKNKPFVLLLHDMTHEVFPETGSKKDKTIEWKKKLVSRADKIIAISENTKRDIIKFYGIEEEKIKIVNWSTSIKLPQKELNIELPNKYILFVGNRDTYKNFELFAKAISPLLNKKKELHLVCAGSKAFSEKETKLFEQFGIGGKVRHIRFNNDEELAQIYNKAICFVFPSLYEGFGLPVLEAFACECPAVISKSSSLPEVGGDAAEYFNPESLESIEKAIDKVLESEELRTQLIRKGKDRLKIFNWKYAAKTFLDTYYEPLKQEEKNSM